MWRDDATLLDIERAARHAVQFAQGATLESLRTDLKLQSAVLYQLTVLGEAVKRLSAEFRAGHSDISWQHIAGLRDRLVHGYDKVRSYDKVRIERVWEVLIADAPALLRQLEPLLPRRSDGEE